MSKLSQQLNRNLMRQSFKLLKEFFPVQVDSSQSDFYVETEPEDNLNYTDEEEQINYGSEELESE